MFPSHVFEKREELVQKIGTLPRDYRMGNVTALLRVLWELQASLVLELQVIRGVKRLDVSDPVAVHDYVDQFDNYVKTGSFNLQRTSSGAIGNAFRRQSEALRESSKQPEASVAAVAELVNEFSSADREFAEDIQPVMNRALRALEEIRLLVVDGKTNEARTRQNEFIREYDDELARIKATLDVLTDRGNQLVASL